MRAKVVREDTGRCTGILQDLAAGDGPGQCRRRSPAAPMAMSMPVVIRPLAYGSTSATLTGLPGAAFVEAFNDGLNRRSAPAPAGFLPTNCIGQPRSS